MLNQLRYEGACSYPLFFFLHVVQGSIDYKISDDKLELYNLDFFSFWWDKNIGRKFMSGE